jgi:hypothetical protein
VDLRQANLFAGPVDVWPPDVRGAILLLDPFQNKEGRVGEETREVVPMESSVPALPIEELAAKVIGVLDMIEERMKLDSPHPDTRNRVRGGRTVSRDVVVALIAAVESMPELQELETFDPAEARDVLEAGDAYRQVAQRMALLLASLNYTIEARWAKVASDALLTLGVAKRRARRPGAAKLAAVVETLVKLLGRKGRKKKKADSE